MANMVNGKKVVKKTVSETDVYRCFYCDKKKHKSAFYIHEVIYNESKLTPICKDCAFRIANRVEYGVSNGMTMESFLRALRLMDKPFIKEVFDTAERMTKDAAVDTKHQKSLFGHYISILVRTKYANSSWEEGETEKKKLSQAEDNTKKYTDEEIAEILNEAEINKRDSIRLIGYDVFTNEPLEDRPRLYAELIKYLDASPESNEDAMKVASIVQIVKAYYQADKINNVIADIMADPQTLLDNAGTLKSLQATQKTLMDTALSLAKDNGISFAHNNSNSKGANTLSGKLKKMRELDLREIEVNAFDIGTSEGMKKVADISNASIIDQIRLNENDIPEMIADQRLLIEKWEKTAFKASEQARILLRENADLKEYIRSIGHEDVLLHHSFAIDADGGVNDEDIQKDEFREMMDGITNIWETEDSLGEKENDDTEDTKESTDQQEGEIEVDPDDIVASEQTEDASQ